MKKPQEAGFYTKIYRKIAKGEAPESRDWLVERFEFIAPLVVGSSVLDLGCGVGYIADMIGERRYLGVDFSHWAIKHSAAITRNPNARFLVRDLRACTAADFRAYDTVLLLEILEHVAEPGHLADMALGLAKRRIIATVPRDMPGTAHVWPTWRKWMVRGLFGGVDQFKLFGGTTNERWYLIVKDVPR